MVNKTLKIIYKEKISKPYQQLSLSVLALLMKWKTKKLNKQQKIIIKREQMETQ